MIWLWVAAALVSAGLAALIVQRAAAAARAAQVGAERPALAVYRRQMAEVDELADRGLLEERERRRVRAETGRRLLAAAERPETPWRVARPGTVVAVAAAPPLAALCAYLLMSPVSLPDQPFAMRLAQWRAADPATLTAPQMAAILRAMSVERPRDPEPLAHLAMAELAAGAPMEADQALQRAIAMAPRRADLWETLGETLTLQENGEVGPDAAADFHAASALDPTAPAPRYFLARAKIAAGDAAGGLADWRTLLAALPPADPRRAQLAAQIDAVQRTGRFEPAAEGPATSEAQGVGAPQIQAMVDSLAARLAASPDDPAGWVRLVRAYAVLGETDRMRAALVRARSRYGGRAEILAQLTAAAASTAAAPGSGTKVSRPGGSP